MTTKPVVTIGVCVRNSASTIPEAMESIINQDFHHEITEAIFVDDGSEDETLSIIKSYVPKMPIQTKIFHTEWKGLGHARNVVVNNAAGDYIIWLDGDMAWPKNYIRKQVEFMQQNPKVGIAKGRYGILSKENLAATLENMSFVALDLRNSRKNNSRLPGTGGSIYRLEAIRQVGGFDSLMKGVGEDLDAAYRIKAAGWFINRNSAVFYEKCRKTWQDIWKQYFWHGYGLYNLYLKNANIFSLVRMTPIAGFVAGALYASDAYRSTRRKSVFLLPFHFAFKMAAWFCGFAKGKADFSRSSETAQAF